MTELQRYLAEEVAEDHADGLISRREALRRLGLLGLGGATAASLLGTFSRRRRRRGSGPLRGRAAPQRRTSSPPRGRPARSCSAGLEAGS